MAGVMGVGGWVEGERSTSPFFLSEKCFSDHTPRLWGPTPPTLTLSLPLKHATHLHATAPPPTQNKKTRPRPHTPKKTGGLIEKAGEARKKGGAAQGSGGATSTNGQSRLLPARPPHLFSYLPRRHKKEARLKGLALKGIIISRKRGHSRTHSLPENQREKKIRDSKKNHSLSL